MFTLAHLSDVHLGPLKWPGFKPLLSKRVIGYLNWRRGRHVMHHRPTVQVLTDDLARQAIDHIAVTGDLVNIGLPKEFDAALEWLTLLGPPADVAVVPGNHDAYVRIERELGIGRWSAYMAPNAAGRKFAEPGDIGFPYVRAFDQVALVGLSSAIPTRPFAAYGRLGKPQLEALPGILDQLHHGGLFRVILLHHPPLPGLASRRRGLRDVGAFSRILREHGAELILYGHDHDQKIHHLETATGRLSAVCVPSTSASVTGHKPLARYNMFQISKKAGDWMCTMVGRGLTVPGGGVEEIERITLTG